MVEYLLSVFNSTELIALGIKNASDSNILERILEFLSETSLITRITSFIVSLLGILFIAFRKSLLECCANTSKWLFTQVKEAFVGWWDETKALLFSLAKETFLILLRRGHFIELEKIKVKMDSLSNKLKNADTLADKYDDTISNEEKEKAKKFVEKLVDIIYNFEAVYDRYQLLQGQEPPNYSSNSWCCWVFILKMLWVLKLNLLNSIRKISIAFSVAKLNHELVELKNSDSYQPAGAVEDDSRQQYQSLPGPVPNYDLVGLQSNKKKLIEMLIAGNKIQFIVVTGEAGIGKTTLVEKVYLDSAVTSYFQLRAFVTVSQTYHQNHILKAIFDQLKADDEPSVSTSQSVTEIEDKIRFYLETSKKSYIIVLDDVWGADDKFSECIKKAFPYNENGSGILMTMRCPEPKVIAHWTTKLRGITFPVQPLSDDDAKLLFCMKAFPSDKVAVEDNSRQYQRPPMSPPDQYELVGLQSGLVGLQSNKENLIKMLKAGNKNNCIYLTGEPGVGKTTLVEKVYLDSEVTSYFELRAFVTVSQTYYPKHILKAIFDQLKADDEPSVSTSSNPCVNEIMGRISNYLRYLKKSYIIVLDDVRGFDERLSDCIKHAFPCIEKGSGILMAIRGGPEAAGPWRCNDLNGYSYHVFPLADSDAELVFCKKALHGEQSSLGKVGDPVLNFSCVLFIVNIIYFINKFNIFLFFIKFFIYGRKRGPVRSITSHTLKDPSDGECPHALKSLLPSILQKCENNPLQIGVVAGILAGKEKTVSTWQTAIDDFSIEFRADSAYQRIKKTLLYSYHNLSYELQQCFLYFGMFPEDSQIYIDTLVHIWVAEGFIKPTDSNHTLEEIAENNLNKLIRRGLVILGYKEKKSLLAMTELREKFVRVHDVFHEIILQKLKDLEFCQVLSKASSSEILNKPFHRLSMNNNGGTNLDLNRINTGTFLNWDKSILGNSWIIRSVLSFKNETFPNFPKTSIICLQRVLLLEHYQKDNFPEVVASMCNLRFLSLTHHKIKEIPEFICKLLNLETLEIKHFCNTPKFPNPYSRRFCELPEEMSMLKKLRHLLLSREVEIPKGVLRSLTALQTLDEIEGKFEYILEELKHLTQLRRLAIVNVNKNYDRLFSEALQEMPELRFLSMCWSNMVPLRDTDSYHNRPPPKKLETVVLWGDIGRNSLSGWIKEIKELRSLSLHLKRSEKWMNIRDTKKTTEELIAALKPLKKLEHLYLRTEGIEQFDFGSDGFEGLRYLMIRDFHLKSIKGSLLSLSELDLRVSYRGTKLNLPDHLEKVVVIRGYDVNRMGVVW